MAGSFKSITYVFNKAKTTLFQISKPSDIRSELANQAFFTPKPNLDSSSLFNSQAEFVKNLKFISYSFNKAYCMPILS